MSRLQESWLLSLKRDIAAYEQDLFKKTGLDFIGIAAAANDISRNNICKAAERFKVAVVTVTAGLGAIRGFAESVAAILSQAGFRAEVMSQTDVSGLDNVYTTPGIGFVFLADDKKYIGLNLNRRRISENSSATAGGYVAALEAMCPGGLTGKDVLMMGYGKVGKLAAQNLVIKGANPILFEKNATSRELGASFGFRICHEIEEIKKYSYILDATNEGGWLTPDLLHENAIISAPGVPLSLTDAAAKKYGNRLVHDLLHIGTLSMLGALCR